MVCFPRRFRSLAAQLHLKQEAYQQDRALGVCLQTYLRTSVLPNTGLRFVLADTEHLHRKIAEMGHRIRSLEDALSIFQAGVSNDVHPLLTDELLALKYGLETVPHDAPGEEQAVPIDGMGTLTITERGDSHYFGRTAGSEVNCSYDLIRSAD